MVPVQPHPFPRSRVAAAVVAGGLLLSGCGGGGDSPSAAPPAAAPSSPSSSDPMTVLAAAYQATSGASTARVQIRTEMSTDGGAGASASSTGVVDGVIDFADDRRSMVAQLPTGGQIETRLVDGVQYVQLPQGLPGQEPGKPWRKITLPPQLSGPTSLDDPTQLLQLLRDAATSVREVGRERVRDTDTTRYSAEIDLARLAAQSGPSPAPGQPDPAAALKQLLGRDTLPMDIWVDAEQRVRRLQTVLPTPSASGTAPPGGGPVTTTPGPTGSATSTQEFYDFGVPVDVQAPPPDQVQEAPTRPAVPAPGAPAPDAPAPGPDAPAPGAPAPGAPAPGAPAPGLGSAAPAVPASASTG